MLVNGQRCERNELNPLDPFARNPDDPLDVWGTYPFACKLSPESEGGFYTSQFQTVNGDARKLDVLATQRSAASPNNVWYDFVNVPEITDLSANKGGSNGGVLTIDGNGFSLDKT